MIICFTGIDGSGKTVQTRKLIERLNAEGYPTVYAWTGGRAYATRPLIWLAKRLLKAPKLSRSKAKASTEPELANSTNDQYRSYLSSTGRLFKNPLIRTLWNHISLIEHTGEILFTVLPHLLRGRIVVCDRYIYDSLIGTAVLADVRPEDVAALLKRASFYPVPRPRQWLFIDIPAAVAFSRRDDVVDVEFLERRIPLYRAMAQALGAHIIDGTPSPEAIADVVWNRVQPLLSSAPRVVLRKG